MIVDGREFYFYGITTLENLLVKIDGLLIVDVYLSSDTRQGRENMQRVSCVSKNIQ